MSLTLIGGGKGRAMNKLLRQVKKSDPYSEFIKILPFLPHQKLPKYLAKADIFIFASSCENMPNTLIEGMAAGMPIASSNKVQCLKSWAMQEYILNQSLLIQLSKP